MSRWQKLNLIPVSIGIIVLVLLAWYKTNFSMENVEAFTVSVPEAEHDLLIATQGSVYKNLVLDGVIEAAKQRKCKISVIDVSDLSNVIADNWTAILILHTWKYSNPQLDAKLFIESQANLNNIVILTTSGEGTHKMQGVDAVTSASSLDRVSEDITEIMRRIDLLLASTND